MCSRLDWIGFAQGVFRSIPKCNIIASETQQIMQKLNSARYLAKKLTLLIMLKMLHIRSDFFVFCFKADFDVFRSSK